MRSKIFTLRRRCMLPTAYSEAKKRKARMQTYQIPQIAEDENEIEDLAVNDDKQRVRREIDDRMNGLNGLTFDLTESDIKDFQEEMESDSENNESIRFIPIDAQMPPAISFKKERCGDQNLGKIDL